MPLRLLGVMQSPYVRRVAVSLNFWDIDFVHQPLSVFRDFTKFAAINPAVKAPTLVLDDGSVLMESSLILSFLEASGSGIRSLTPTGPGALARSARAQGLALAACEKAIQILYEHTLRPPEKRHEPWLERVRAQLDGACAALEREFQGAETWLNGQIMLADITAAVAWRFMADVPELQLRFDRFPALARLSAAAEALPEFRAAAL